MPNNYASFYDDAQQNWSVAFDGEQHLFQFAKQVCVIMMITVQWYIHVCIHV